MSSILARLARLEESVSGSRARDEEETSLPLETGKEDININPTSRQESECPATSSSSRLQSSASKVLELEQTIISTQDLSSLVWARCPQFKGGDAWLPARLCDNAEGAAFRDIDFPIPTDKVLVEFFNLPKTIPRLTTVKRGAVHPFHRGPPTRCRHKEICEDVWSVDDMDRVKVLLKDKFNVSNAGRIYEAMTATATEFLRLALAAASINIAENVSQENGTTEDSHSALNASVDLKRFILAPDHKKKQILRAGDWVQFEHAILRCTMRTRVLRVEAAARFPLSLENGECLERTCLLLRLPCSPESSAGQGEAGGTSMLLEDFCLEDSELRDVETFDATLRAEALRGRRQLEESTGFSLNHPRTSNKENKVLSAAKRKCFSSLLANEEKTKKRSSQISESDSNHSKVSRSYIASDDDDLIFEDSLPSGGNVNCTADVNGTSKRRKRSSQSLTTGRL